MSGRHAGQYVSCIRGNTWWCSIVVEDIKSFATLWRGRKYWLDQRKRCGVVASVHCICIAAAVVTTSYPWLIFLLWTRIGPLGILVLPVTAACSVLLGRRPSQQYWGGRFHVSCCSRWWCPLCLHSVMILESRMYWCTFPSSQHCSSNFCKWFVIVNVNNLADGGFSWVELLMKFRPSFRLFYGCNLGYALPKGFLNSGMYIATVLRELGARAIDKPVVVGESYRWLSLLLNKRSFINFHSIVEQLVARYSWQYCRRRAVFWRLPLEV